MRPAALVPWGAALAKQEWQQDALAAAPQQPRQSRTCGVPNFRSLTAIWPARNPSARGGGGAKRRCRLPLLAALPFLSFFLFTGAAFKIRGRCADEYRHTGVPKAASLLCMQASHTRACGLATPCHRCLISPAPLPRHPRLLHQRCWPSRDARPPPAALFPPSQAHSNSSRCRGACMQRRGRNVRRRARRRRPPPMPPTQQLPLITHRRQILPCSCRRSRRMAAPQMFTTPFAHAAGGGGSVAHGDGAGTDGPQRAPSAARAPSGRPPLPPGAPFGRDGSGRGSARLGSLALGELSGKHRPLLLLVLEVGRASAATHVRAVCPCL